jgi:hypothetical protein
LQNLSLRQAGRGIRRGAVRMLLCKSSSDEESGVRMRVRQGCDQIFETLCFRSRIESESDLGFTAWAANDFTE